MGEEKIKILFLNADTGDYLNISLLHGLKSLPNVEVYDYPKSEVLYRENREQLQPYVRGNGFSLFFTLSEKPMKRFHLLYDDLQNGFFDLVIFGDIQASFGMYVQLLPALKNKKAIFLDGSDSPALFGYSGSFWRKPYYWLIPKPHKSSLYFKREWTEDTKYYRYYKLVPKSLLRFLPEFKNVRPISFSFPQEKIVSNLPEKTKLFPTHIVDEEVANKVEGSFTSYAFKNEADYYNDLQQSKFGITTKRAGWDCLRHYEIAANGAVICFKDLDKKPINCAPHGLVPGKNCLAYSRYEDLIKQTNLINDAQYNELCIESLKWVLSNSTKAMALRFLETSLEKGLVF